MRVAVVHNPHSKSARRDPGRASRLGATVRPVGELIAPADLAELDREVGALKSKGVGVIAVDGGDGTLHRVATALLRTWGTEAWPALVSLRGGTMNTIARGLGARRGTPEALLARVVRHVESGTTPRTAQRSVLVVDDDLAGCLFGLGLFARFIAIYDELGAEGRLHAAVTLSSMAARAVVGRAPELFEPLPARVTADGVAWPERPWRLIAAGTVDDVGLGFRPFYKCLWAPGRMHAVGLSSSPAEIVRELVPVRLARPLRHPGNTDAVCRELVVECDEPMVRMIDGDLHPGGERVKIAVGPSVTWWIPRV